MTGTISLDLLNGLARIFTLPDFVEAERQKMLDTEHMLQLQREAEDPGCVFAYPVKAKLFKHQIRAANMAMMVFDRSPKPSAGFGLLFEMGCGKTLTAIAIAGSLYRHGMIGRVLVVAPTSVCSVWPHDLEAFANFKYSVEVLLGDKKKRVEALERLEKPGYTTDLKIAVINYESTHRDGIFEALVHYDADLIICDESQRIKNHAAAQSKAMHRLGDAAKYKLILSGTPVQNNAVDLFSQYRFLDSSVFGTNFYAFRNRYCILGGYGQHQIVGYRNMEQLIEKEHSIAYRVTKEECLDLPPQTFVRRYVQFEPAERKVYDQIRRSSFAELENGDSITATTVLTKMLRLMQLTGGFIQTDGSERPQQVNTAKLAALEDILDDYVIETGKKLVIFARFRAEIASIEALLQRKGIKYGSIYGDIPQTERGQIVDDFQNNDDTKVFVAQIQTAGLGITLHAANVAVFYSIDYNYANYAQALARIHRIGQHNPVTYIHLLVEHSIDDKVMEALERKEDIAKSIVDSWRTYF
jgi:SNF2 family DNA or RNA helicase